MMDRERERLFSEAETQQILRRAAEVDASGSARFTTTDLYGIAAEAGIERAALERAMQEVAQSGALPQPRASNPTWWLTLLRGGGLLATGVGLGALGVFADGLSLGPESAAAVFGPSMVFTIYRALWHRWHGNLPDFLREATLTLGSMALTVTALAGYHATGIFLGFASACVAGGSALVMVGLRRSGRSSEARASVSG